MNDTTITPELLAALLAQAQGTTNPQPAIGGWTPPQPTTQGLNIQGVSVPVSVQTPAGKVRVQFILGAEYAQNPAALSAVLEQMINAGIPIDAWQAKEQSGGSWGNGNRGSYGNNGGNKGWQR